MNRRSPFARACILPFLCATLLAVGQTPAPPIPPLTKEQREAAAAIEAPRTFVPPPLPGQLQGGPPARPNATVPAQAPVPPPAPAAVPTNSASKMQVLEAVTQKPAFTEVPRVLAPSDKIPVTSSTSASQQFIVHGKVFETRSAMSTRCDEISQDLRKVLNDKEPWVLPIVVVLNTGDEATKSKGPTISTTISELDFGGFHLQVTINERPGLGAADLRKEIVRALLAERILRNHQKIETPEGRLLLPDWIMTGVLLALDYRASATPSAVFSTLFRSGKIYGIEEIIESSPTEMDSLSRTIYETSCCALVLALVDQPSGPQHFNKFLNALASDPRSERELLSAAFPNFAASASSLNKWWSLQLAALAQPGIAEPLNPAESIKAIEEAITLHYEVLPAEVPKNVKLHPFVLPAPLQVIARNEPRTPAAAANAPSKSKPQAATPETAEEEGKPKRSLFRRLLFLGDPGEKETEPKAADKPTETAAAEKEAKPTDDKKPGFVGRLFGAGNNEKKAPEKNKGAATEKPRSKPKAEAKSEPEVKEEKKASKLNPMNWFRGGKKPAEEKTEDKPAKDKKAVLLPSPAPLDFARLISPVLADAWQLLAPAAPRQTAEPLFGFRKRKPKAEDTPKAESSEATPVAEDRPPVKKSSVPHTNNRNAKPASKSPAKTSDKTRTTNPNAKPATPEQVKAAPASTTDTAAAESSQVQVKLPLEEYQHILKHPDRSQILSYNIASLRALELRVSVLFRPVIMAYLAAVLDIEKGKTKNMDKRLAALHEFTLIAYQKSIAVRDYLDWFEASESGRLSGKFDDYLKLPDTIQKELPPRTDPISKYLDAIDKEFTK
jgi:hypothetical protein